jgi:hypothetical protein
MGIPDLVTAFQCSLGDLRADVRVQKSQINKHDGCLIQYLFALAALLVFEKKRCVTIPFLMAKTEPRSFKKYHETICRLLRAIEKGSWNGKPIGLRIESFLDSYFDEETFNFVETLDLKDHTLSVIVNRLVSGLNSFGSGEQDWSEILGRVYEQIASMESGELGRKEAGAYYTPKFVTQFIVAKTFEKLLTNGSKSVLEQRVLDPAAGAGHFLINASEFLFKKLFGAIRTTRSLKGKCNIVETCIFGADINPTSVSIAKLNLWIYLAYKGARLPSLRKNIVVSDSLTGLPSSARYTAIIGNPPYVRIHKQNPKYTVEIRRRFPSLAGDFDLYMAFILKAEEMLHDGGGFGFIIPNKFFSRKCAQPLRADLAANWSLDYLADLGRAKDIFDASVYTGIIVARKRAPSDLQSVQISVSSTSATQSFKQEPNRIRQRNLAADNWKLTADSGLAKYLRGKLGRTRTMNKVFQYELFCGTPRACHYYAWADFLKSDKKPSQRFVPYYVCRSIKPGKIEWGGKINSLKKKLDYPVFDVSKAPLSDNLRKNFLSPNKILIRGNDYRLTAALDRKGSVFVGVYGMIFEEKKNAELANSWMNSTFANFFFRLDNETTTLSGGYFSINSPQIHSLLVPESLAKFNRNFDESKSSRSWEETIARTDAELGKFFGVDPEYIVKMYDTLGDKFDPIKSAFLRITEKKGRKAA